MVVVVTAVEAEEEAAVVAEEEEEEEQDEEEREQTSKHQQINKETISKEMISDILGQMDDFQVGILFCSVLLCYSFFDYYRFV